VQNPCALVVRFFSAEIARLWRGERPAELQNPPTSVAICLAKQFIISHRAVTRRASNRIIDLAGQLVFA
jgi:hypothetical protein